MTPDSERSRTRLAMVGSPSHAPGSADRARRLMDQASGWLRPLIDEAMSSIAVREGDYCLSASTWSGYIPAQRPYPPPVQPRFGSGSQ
jgi:hypothetical protein